MRQYGLYVLDLDGTVYRGSEAVPFAADVINQLIERGSLVRYFTNNSAARPVVVSHKLQGMGFPCEPAWVYGTGPLAAKVCRERQYKAVHIVGEMDLKETFQDEGVPLASADAADCVVVGICRTFTYHTLDRASSLVRGGADLIVTNRDATYPVEGGREQPGAGSIAAAVETAAGRSAIELGKPQTALLDWVLTDTGASPENTVVVGDRYETDIVCGLNAGCDTRLVLTGVSEHSVEGVSAISDLRGLL